MLHSELYNGQKTTAAAFKPSGNTGNSKELRYYNTIRSIDECSTYRKECNSRHVQNKNTLFKKTNIMKAGTILTLKTLSMKKRLPHEFPISFKLRFWKAKRNNKTFQSSHVFTLELHIVLFWIANGLLVRKRTVRMLSAVLLSMSFSLYFTETTHFLFYKEYFYIIPFTSVDGLSFTRIHLQAITAPIRT